MQSIKKWKIVVNNEKHITTLYIYDNHYQNIFRKLTDIAFDFEPDSIVITEEKLSDQIGTTALF